MTKAIRVPQLRWSVHTVLTVDQWLARKIEPPDNLLGELFSTTSRVLLSADTGLGKTMLGIAVAFAIRFQKDLMHWKASKRRRKPRVLFIDGEMPRDLMQERIALACKWFGVESSGDGLFFLSREDFEDMPPLDTDEGQKWMNGKIRECHPDFIIFDNISALSTGVQREEESWTDIKPWFLELTRRRIGQLWLHHVGHDKSRAYGTKTREWQMDTVIVGRKSEGSEALVAMELHFEKARRRKPSNFSDFEPVTIELQDDEWTSRQQQPKEKIPTSAEPVLRALREAIAKLDEAVTEEQWRAVAYEMPITTKADATDRAKQIAFKKGMQSLLERGIVTVTEDDKYDLPR